MSRLRIDIESDSYFLREHTKFEVRDGSMRLIDEVPAGILDGIKLDPGLYHVSAVLADGRNHVKLVRVADEDQRITFKLAGDTASVSDRESAETSSTAKPKGGFATGEQYKQLLQRFGAPPPARRGPPAPDPVQLRDSAPVALRKVSNASARKVSALEWLFEPEGDGAIPVATFETVAGALFRLSLPTNPSGHFPLNACTVVFVAERKELEPRCWIAPERIVANTLQHWLVNGQVSKAKGLAGEATALLASKYSDPTGALLGALVLFKFGLLGEYRGWLENLVRDFGWLTDARILELALRAEEAGPSQQLLADAIALGREPILYTESYSILINLLRRWPGGKSADTPFQELTSEALGDLAERTVNVEWSAVVLTVKEDLKA